MELPKIDLSDNKKKVIIGVGAVVLLLLLLFFLRGGKELPPSALIETSEDPMEQGVEDHPKPAQKVIVRDPLLAPADMGPINGLIEISDTPIGTPYLIWQGVFLGPDEVRGAILNGEVCREGEIVNGVMIVSIQKETLTVEYDGSSYDLRLGEPVGEEAVQE